MAAQLHADRMKKKKTVCEPMIKTMNHTLELSSNLRACQWRIQAWIVLVL